MALVTTDDLAASLGVVEPRLTAEVARNEIHLKVGQQEEPHYLGWLPGVFGQIFPASQRGGCPVLLGSRARVFGGYHPRPFKGKR